MPISKVIVVGSGPAGLLLALMLGQVDIPVVVLEASDHLDTQPRASHYATAAIHELTRAGIMDEVRSRGFIPDGVTWRKIDGTPLTGLKSDKMPYEDRMACLPLGKLAQIMVDRIKELPHVEIKWKHKVTGIGQEEDKAWVTVEGAGRFEADYVVGCDGANSIVRRSLFGDKNFPGMTWDKQIVATNVYYDMSPYDWGDSSFIIDEEHWSMIATIQPDGLLRITYGEVIGLSHEEYLERLPKKFASFVPGRPGPEKYKVVNFSPYKVHQRCAESLRVGRILLAADAGHVCNPFGGMGLTGGIVDVGNLFDCLNGIHKGLASDAILDRYDEVRRAKYREVIDPVSSANIRRMWEDPNTIMEKDDFLKACSRAETDPDFSKMMQSGVRAIMHDFTQEYDKTPEGVTAAPS